MDTLLVMDHKRKIASHLNFLELWLSRKISESIEESLANNPNVLRGDGVVRQKPYFDLGGGILRGGQN